MNIFDFYFFHNENYRSYVTAAVRTFEWAVQVFYSTIWGLFCHCPFLPDRFKSMCNSAVFVIRGTLLSISLGRACSRIWKQLIPYPACEMAREYHGIGDIHIAAVVKIERIQRYVGVAAPICKMTL